LGRAQPLEHTQIELVREVAQVSVALVTVHEFGLLRSESVQTPPEVEQMLAQVRDVVDEREKRQLVAVSVHRRYPATGP
jgi:hypothetical protein